MFVYTVLLHVI